MASERNDIFKILAVLLILINVGIDTWLFTTEFLLSQLIFGTLLYLLLICFYKPERRDIYVGIIYLFIFFIIIIGIGLIIKSWR